MLWVLRFGCCGRTVEMIYALLVALLGWLTVMIWLAVTNVLVFSG